MVTRTKPAADLNATLTSFYYLALGARTKLVLNRQTALLLLYDATLNSQSAKVIYVGHCQSSGGCHSPTDLLCKFLRCVTLPLLLLGSTTSYSHSWKIHLSYLGLRSSVPCSFASQFHYLRNETLAMSRPLSDSAPSRSSFPS